MKKCPNCGYVRRPEDDEYAMVPAKACPRCYAFYPSDQPAPAVEKKPESPPLPPKPPMSGAKWLVIVAAAMVLSFAAAFYIASRPREAPLSEVSRVPGEAVTIEAGPAGSPAEKVYSISEIVKMISPSVVSILNYNRSREIAGRGTGFFTGGPGEVVTSRHVLRDAAYAEIRTSDGRTYPINRIISEDDQNDLVVLATGVPPGEARPLKISTFMPERGDKVIVIGGPLGLEQSVSDGIVSAYRSMNNRKVIQITAPISPGSSGSPVVNSRGEVVGIAFMQLVRGQNLNFCIPGETILNLRPSAGSSLARVSSGSSDKFYFYQDESKKVYIVKNPENPGPNYVLLTRPDGSIDKDKYENWIFEQMGGDPYKIDPQAMVNAEKEKLPELFRQVFPGHEIDELRRFAPESRGYWGSWVANHMQAVYNNAHREKASKIAMHKQLMDLLDRAQRQ